MSATRDLTPRAPRRRRSLPAVVVAVALGAGAATLAVDVISVRVQGRSLIWDYPRIASQMRQATWGDGASIAIAAGVTAVGILLVLAAVLPGSRKLLAIAVDAPDAGAGTSKRSVKRVLHHAADDVDGVDHVAVKLRRRRARITVTSPLRDPGDLGARVEADAQRRLDGVRLTRPPAVKVRVRHREDD